MKTPYWTVLSHAPLVTPRVRVSGLSQYDQLALRIGAAVFTFALWLWIVGVLSVLGLGLYRLLAGARRSKSWVADLVRNERRSILGSQSLRLRLGTFLRRAVVLTTTPSIGSAGLIALVTMILVGALYALSRWYPGPQPSLTYYTLWQVQSALAGAALPFLVFVIELAKDDQTTGQRTAEVLIRHTWVFPIIASSLFGLLLVGVGAQWFASTVLNDFGFIVHAATIALVVFAYWRALRLLFDREALREKSIQLLKERLDASVDDAIDKRIGAQIMVTAASKLGLKYSPFEPNPHDPRLVVLEAPSAGYVTDVNLRYLEEFVRELPWRAAAATASSLVVQAPQPPVGKPTRPADMPAVLLLKLYGDRLYVRDRGLVALAVRHFEKIEKRALERRLEKVFRVGGFE